MDGAGRLARSQRPQADLKAAALGAAILLREYVSARLPRVRFSRGGTKQRRPVGRDRATGQAVAPVALVEREAPARLIELVEQYLPRRLGTVATVALLF